VAAARDAVAAQIADGEKNPTTVGMEMVRGSAYAGAAARPLLGTRESIAAVGPSDVTAFRTAHYVRGNAFVAANGAVDDAANAGARAVLTALPPGSEPPARLVPRALTTEAKRVVTHRDVGVPFVMIGFDAPALADADFAPMLVLRAMIADIADRADVATGGPAARGLDVLYAYDVKPATFGIAINGALVDPQAALTIVEAVAHNAVTKPFAPEVIRRYREAARGQWALEALTLDDREWQMGAAVTQGADAATARGVIAAIDRVTAADLQRAARRYLQRSIVALVLPRSPHS
jgi:zinc protease